MLSGRGRGTKQQWQHLRARRPALGVGRTAGLVLEGTNRSRSKRQVSASSKAPSKTLEMNEMQHFCDATARGEALMIKEEQEPVKAARCSAWV